MTNPSKPPELKRIKELKEFCVLARSSLKSLEKHLVEGNHSKLSFALLPAKELRDIANELHTQVYAHVINLDEDALKKRLK